MTPLVLEEPKLKERVGLEVLLLEDEENPRRQLSDLLGRRGIVVNQAVSMYSELEIPKDRVCVALIDIQLNGEPDGPDGIEAAKKIHAENKLVSIIFVSAYVKRPRLKARAHALQEHGVRIASCFDKPLNLKKIDAIAALIKEEHEHLAGLADSSTSDLSADSGSSSSRMLSPRGSMDYSGGLTTVSPECRPTAEEPTWKEEPSLATVQARIDEIYDDMRELVTAQQGDPGLKDDLKPLRAELRQLQEIEADQIERQYMARFKFDPAAADRAIERAEKLLSEPE